MKMSYYKIQKYNNKNNISNSNKTYNSANLWSSFQRLKRGRSKMPLKQLQVQEPLNPAL